MLVVLECTLLAREATTHAVHVLTCQTRYQQVMGATDTRAHTLTRIMPKTTGSPSRCVQSRQKVGVGVGHAPIMETFCLDTRKNFGVAFRQTLAKKKAHPYLNRVMLSIFVTSRGPWCGAMGRDRGGKPFWSCLCGNLCHTPHVGCAECMYSAARFGTKTERRKKKSRSYTYSGKRESVRRRTRCSVNEPRSGSCASRYDCAPRIDCIQRTICYAACSAVTECLFVRLPFPKTNGFLLGHHMDREIHFSPFWLLFFCLQLRSCSVVWWKLFLVRDYRVVSSISLKKRRRHPTHPEYRMRSSATATIGMLHLIFRRTLRSALSLRQH